MLSKKYRLPVQSVTGKTPVATYRGRYFSVKRFGAAGGVVRIGVVVPAGVIALATRRAACRRMLYEAARKGIEIIQPGEYLVVMRQAYPPQEVGAIIKELMNVLSR